MRAGSCGTEPRLSVRVVLLGTGAPPPNPHGRGPSPGRIAEDLAEV